MVTATQVEISKRLKAYRILSSMTQQDLADKTGLSLRSISNLESGKDVQASTLITVIEYFGLEAALLSAIPNSDERPSVQVMKAKGQAKQRVRKTHVKRTTFKWGDEA